MIVQTQSPHDTLALGESLGRNLPGGLVIALVGELGTGKTHLTKGIALGNGLDDPSKVTSPTFTLVNQYPGRLTLFHLDAYRLRSSAELAALGFDEMIAPTSAVVVEWADRVMDQLSEPLLRIDLEVIGENARRLTLSAAGRVADHCLSCIQ